MDRLPLLDLSQMDALWPSAATPAAEDTSRRNGCHDFIQNTWRKKANAPATTSKRRARARGQTTADCNSVTVDFRLSLCGAAGLLRVWDMSHGKRFVPHFRRPQTQQLFPTFVPHFRRPQTQQMPSLPPGRVPRVSRLMALALRLGERPAARLMPNRGLTCSGCAYLPCRCRLPHMARPRPARRNEP
jgi:hypothetical protein